ncbi:hypothetical protein CEXT_719031 [Caerostris extrusa]|uniref:Uncharacterized protein n=1 Tax=Caerostris extrusa TaxID=172846 RepID=A0AAV4U452_CAEEX|nr:hypothetical protein CEXT_719031 [Caerostris extrusa]
MIIDWILGSHPKLCPGEKLNSMQQQSNYQESQQWVSEARVAAGGIIEKCVAKEKLDAARTRSYTIQCKIKSICVNTFLQIIQWPPRYCQQTIADIPVNIRQDRRIDRYAPGLGRNNKYDHATQRLGVLRFHMRRITNLYLFETLVPAVLFRETPNVVKYSLGFEGGCTVVIWFEVQFKFK